MQYYNLFIEFLNKYGYPIVVTSYLLVRQDKRLDRILDLQEEILKKLHRILDLQEEILKKLQAK
jgi:hypothetical protein